MDLVQKNSTAIPAEGFDLGASFSKEPTIPSPVCYIPSSMPENSKIRYKMEPWKLLVKDDVMYSIPKTNLVL